MTSQKDQIQALIAEIDSVLQKANSRLPWVMSGEIAQQRQVLERVRNYLVVLQQQLPVDGLRQDTAYSSPVGYPPEFYPSGASGSRSPAIDAQQMMQTILQEMSYLRASVMQPMQADLENLRQRRELLTQELSHLEAERQNQALAQRSSNPQQFTDELVQVLMSRLQESLSQQIGQTLGNLQAQALSHGANSYRSGDPLPGALANPQYEQLQALRSRSDQMLVNLDSTLNIVFESLQRNIQAYQASLTQGLERMHSLGQQSEVAFKTLVSELAQQLNQEASSHLLSLAQGQPTADIKTETEATSPTPTELFNLTPETGLDLPTHPPTHPSIAPNPSPNFPYPGIEVLATDLSTTDLIGSIAAEEQSLPPMPELDAALDSWLRSADSGNFEGTELTSNALDWGTPSNNAASAQPEVDFPTLSDAAIPGARPLESFADVSQIAGSDEFTSDLALTDLALTEEDTAELDDALKLLEDLSSDLNDSLAIATLQDADAQIDQMLSLVQAAAPEAVSSAEEDSFVEQDEFYQSLFGERVITQADHAKPAAIAPLSNRSNDFLAADFPAATYSAVTDPAVADPAVTDPAVTDPAVAEVDRELDNLDQFATLSDFTFESSGSDLELPELFFEAAAAAEIEPTFITELPASLFEDVSIAAPSEDPFPLTLETESLLADLQPFSLEPDNTGSLSDLFQDLSLESAQSTPAAPPAIAIDWAALQNIAPMATPSQSVPSDALTMGLPDSEFALEGGEDQFTRAALDENLLPDAFHEVTNLSLDLDDITLGSLSEDLFNVETSTTWQSDRGADDASSLDEFALFLDDSSQETAQPLEQFFSDRADLTVEEFGSLFDDAPTTIPPPPAVSSSLPTFPLPDTQSLAEPPPTSTAQLPPLPQVADDGSLPFTLEGMDDLFGDAPSLVAIPSPPAPQQPLSDPSLSSLGMQDLLGASLSSPPMGTETSLPFTLEGMDDLFSDAPSVEVTAASAPRPPAKEISPFKPDNRQRKTAETTSFNLEQLNDLLIEAPPMTPAPLDGRRAEVKAPEVKAPEVKAPEVKTPEVKTPEVKTPEVKAPEVKAQKRSNTPNNSLLGSPPVSPDANFSLGLDEAFESLLGKPTPSQPATLNEQATEKKKTL